VEKIIHLHICYAWSIKDARVKKAIIAMEHALSKAGVAGGAVVLTKMPSYQTNNQTCPPNCHSMELVAERYFHQAHGLNLTRFGNTSRKINVQINRKMLIFLC